MSWAARSGDQAAFVRDLDGHRLEAVVHETEVRETLERRESVTPRRVAGGDEGRQEP